MVGVVVEGGGVLRCDWRGGRTRGAPIGGVGVDAPQERLSRVVGVGHVAGGHVGVGVAVARGDVAVGAGPIGAGGGEYTGCGGESGATLHARNSD